MPALDIQDLPPDLKARVRKATGRKRLPGARSFTADQERSYALRVCALIADLTQDQRRRVLSRALKVNAV